MADVEMPDVDQAASSKPKTVTKTSKAGPAESANDGKKRFEVKKVCLDGVASYHQQLIDV